MVKRLEEWPLKLSRFLRERQFQPFKWGENDCLMFPADGVLAMTGFDPAAAWRGYTTEEEALQLLEQHGGVEGLITAGLGVESHRNPLLAKRGDVVMLDLPEGMTGGIVDDTGQRVAVPLRDNKTLARIHLKLAVQIWSF